MNKNLLENLKDSETYLSNLINFFKNLEKKKNEEEIILNHLKSIKDNIQIFHDKNIELFYELMNLLLEKILKINNKKICLITLELFLGITNLKDLNIKDTYLFNKINKENFSNFLEFLLPEFSNIEIDSKKNDIEKQNKKTELPNLNKTENGEKIIKLMSAISNNNFIGSYFYKILTYMEDKQEDKQSNNIVNKIIKDNLIYDNIYFPSKLFPILINSLSIFNNEINYNNINNKSLSIEIFINVLRFFYGEIDGMVYEKSTDVKNFLIKCLNVNRIKEKGNNYEKNIIDFFSNLLSSEKLIFCMPKILFDALNRKRFDLYEKNIINILKNVLKNNEYNIRAKNNIIYILFYMFKNKNIKIKKIMCNFLIEENIKEIIISIIKNNDNIKLIINFILKLSIFYKEFYFEIDYENNIYNFIEKCVEIFIQTNKDNMYNNEIEEIQKNLNK